MKNLSYFLLASILFASTSSNAQENFNFERQGKMISLTENIHTFSWNDFSKQSEIDNGYFGWVQFYETPTQSVQDFFKSNNLQLVEYISNKTYLFYFPKNTSASLLRNKGVRSIVPVPWDSKIERDLLNGDIPSFAKEGNNILVTLEHYNHVSSDMVINDLLAQKIILKQQYKGNSLLELSIPNNCLEELANQSYVKWIEFKAAPEVKEDTRGKSIHRSNSLDTQSVSGNNYTGAGIGVLVRDDGIVGPHIDFQGRIDNSNASGSGQTHGDGVAGILAGAGNLDPTKRGMAAGSNVFVSNYASSFLDGATTGLIGSGAVQITNSSYGDGCNGGYTSRSRTVDQQINATTSLLHVFSAGNSGTSNCGYGAGSGWGNITGGHKQGKNVIATANVFFDGSLANSSSKGPAYDGRIKPDITAHGQGQQSTNENNQYLSFGGTSGAAPGIAGVSAQLYELYASMNGGSLPQSALIKASLLNTANDYGNVGPDFNFGWGLVNGNRAGNLLENNHYLSDNITQGNSNTHSISVPSGITQVRFMLYWNDPAANTGASSALVNDLDLEVIDPSNNTLLPYVLDATPNATNLNMPATNGVDRLNNMEQVLINTPATGNYTINVSGFNVPMGPQEYFVVYELIEEELTITYPNGSESFVPGEAETLHWDAVNTTNNFVIDYSTDNGGSWNNITTASATTTNINWTVPQNVTGEGLIRITSGSFQDISDANFSISNQPNNFQISRVCPTEATFTWTQVTNAEEYDVYLLGTTTMEVAGTTSTTSLTVPIPNGEQIIWAAIVAKNNTENWESRRTVAIDNTGLLNCSFATDLAVTGLNSSEDFNVLCTGSSDVTISVDVINLGTNPQSGFTVSYQLDSGAVIQETYSATLGSGQNATISFAVPLNISSNGESTLNYEVALSGDENSVNNTDALTFYATTEATSLDFAETFEVDGFPPRNWTVTNPDNATTWIERTNVIGSDGASTVASYVDGANYTDRGQEDTFTTEYFDLQNMENTFLRFDLAKAQWSASYNDELRVEVSTDCGMTYTSIYDLDGLNLATTGYVASTWSPSSAGDWRNEEVSLTPFEGETVVFRFVNVNDYSNSTFIDNINVVGTNATTPPVAVCQDITISLDSAGNATITGTQVDGGSTSTAGIDTLTVDQSTFSCNDIGVNSIILTVTDVNGMTDTCTAMVTVEDNTAPNPICQDITVDIQSNGLVSILPSEIDNGSNDSCGAVTMSLDVTTFDCNDVGTNTVTLTVMDGSGNMSSCIATVTVIDSNNFCNGAPNAVCQALTMNADSNCEADASAIDFDNGSSDPNNDTLTYSVSPEGPYPLGETTVVLTVNDGTLSSQCTTTITVVDSEAPTAACQNITVQLDENGTTTISASQLDNGSSDNCGAVSFTIDVTTFTCDEIGDNTVTLTVEDENGNMSSCTAIVTVEDITGPTFDQNTLPQGPIFRNVAPATGMYTFEDFTAAVIALDGCTETLLPISITQDPAVGTEVGIGTYNVTITAMDDSGNMTDYLFELQVDTDLGTEDLTLASLLLYPNPMKEYVTLSNPNNLEIENVSIFDLQGRLVKKVPMNSMNTETPIYISGLKSASYIVVIKGTNGSSTKTMIKE